jgi:hypothetical protein
MIKERKYYQRNFSYKHGVKSKPGQSPYYALTREQEQVSQNLDSSFYSAVEYVEELNASSEVLG